MISMHTIFTLILLVLLIGCSKNDPITEDKPDESIASTSRPALKPDTSTRVSGFVWDEQNVSLLEQNFVGKKMTFVPHNIFGLDADPYYQSGAYPYSTEFNFYPDGLVHRYNRRVNANDKAIVLKWEVEGNKLFVNDGSRRRGTAHKTPLAIEFNRRPGEEVVVKWLSGVRGKTDFARIHDIAPIPAAEQINPDFYLSESDILGRSITISFTGGDDITNPTFHFGRNDKGVIIEAYKDDRDIRWTIEGRDLKIGSDDYSLIFRFQRKPEVGDEIERIAAFRNGPERTERVFVYDLE